MTERLTYKGSDIPINLGVVSYKRARKELGKAIEDAIIEDDVLTYETLLWYSMEAGFYLEGKTNPYKREEAEWIFNECEDEFLQIYMKSQMKGFERNKAYLEKMGMSVSDAVKIQAEAKDVLKKNPK